MFKKGNFLLGLILMVSLIGCNRNSKDRIEISRAFYFWKSVFNLNDFEKQEIKNLNVDILYLKFFDVGWDVTFSKPLPVAVLKVKDKDFFKANNLQIIPTVFITNETLYKIKIEQCPELATNIIKLVNEISSLNNIPNVKEIQIDCDWTSETKEKFFAIVDHLKSIDSSVIYSATIRLHQVKYVQKSGVPDVERGMLMAYNMGNLKNPDVTNSILDVNELKKYSSFISTYPLPLDVALPLFDWCVIFRNNSYIGLMQNLNAKELESFTQIVAKDKYLLKKDTIINGFQFLTGDIIRNEKSEYNDVIAAAKIIKKQLNSVSFRVALYHLDSSVLQKYSNNEIENLYNCFY